MISPSQRPLPDNTQHSQQTNIHAPGGIRTHDLSKRAAVDLRLRPRGYWDWHYCGYKCFLTGYSLRVKRHCKRVTALVSLWDFYDITLWNVRLSMHVKLQKLQSRHILLYSGQLKAELTHIIYINNPYYTGRFANCGLLAVEHYSER